MEVIGDPEQLRTIGISVLGVKTAYQPRPKSCVSLASPMVVRFGPMRESSIRAVQACELFRPDSAGGAPQLLEPPAADPYGGWCVRGARAPGPPMPIQKFLMASPAFGVGCGITIVAFEWRLPWSVGSFEQLAHLREVGEKFYRYLDLIFLQYGLTPSAGDAQPRNSA